MELTWTLVHDRDSTWHLFAGAPEPDFPTEAVDGWQPPTDTDTSRPRTTLTTLNCAACRRHPLYAAVLRTERAWIDAELIALGSGPAADPGAGPFQHGYGNP